MLLSGRRETISTAPKSFSVRARTCVRVNGNCIMVPSMGNRRRGQNTPTPHLWVVSKKGLKLHEAERDAAAAGPAPAGDSGAAAQKGPVHHQSQRQRHGLRGGPNQAMRGDGSEWPNPH